MITSEVTYEEFYFERKLNQMCHLKDEQAIFVTVHDDADMIQLFSRLSRTVNAAVLSRARAEYMV